VRIVIVMMCLLVSKSPNNQAPIYIINLLTIPENPHYMYCLKSNKR